MMQRAFDRLSETSERFLASWWGFCSIVAGIVACFSLWGWDGADRYIYVIGFLIVALLIGAGRRDAKAVHAKLDAMTPGHDLDRLEERAEREIEEMRDG